MLMGFAIFRYGHGSELKFVVVVGAIISMLDGFSTHTYAFGKWYNYKSGYFVIIIGMDRRQIILILHIVVVCGCNKTY